MTLQIAASVIFVAASVIGALLLSTNAIQIIRLFEGYWGPAKWFQAALKGYHAARRGSLEPSDRYLIYPSLSNEVMPTLIGNVLRTAELHPERLYSANATVVWPRLHRLLPPGVIADLAAARQRMELPMVIALYASVLLLGCAFALPFELDG